MAMKQFENLKRFFHLSDNSKILKKGAPNYDVLYKVRPMLGSLQEKCRNVAPEENHSIEEQIILTKSHCPIRQYLTNKAN